MVLNLCAIAVVPRAGSVTHCKSKTCAHRAGFVRGGFSICWLHYRSGRHSASPAASAAQASPSIGGRVMGFFVVRLVPVAQSWYVPGETPRRRAASRPLIPMCACHARRSAGVSVTPARAMPPSRCLRWWTSIPVVIAVSITSQPSLLHQPSILQSAAQPTARRVRLLSCAPRSPGHCPSCLLGPCH